MDFQVLFYLKFWLISPTSIHLKNIYCQLIAKETQSKSLSSERNE